MDYLIIELTINMIEWLFIDGYCWLIVRSCSSQPRLAWCQSWSLQTRTCREVATPLDACRCGEQAELDALGLSELDAMPSFYEVSDWAPCCFGCWDSELGRCQGEGHGCMSVFCDCLYHSLMFYHVLPTSLVGS